MVSSDTAESPLESAAGVVGPRVTDAFKLLSNETRLAILLALWEEYDPRAADNAVSFSELYDRVAMRGSGNFTYHLDKLTGHYVTETADGYRLRDAGHKIIQGVVSGTGLQERTLQPTEIDRSCHRCGAPVELSYENEQLYQKCTECEGNLGTTSTEQAPEGTLLVSDFPPAGLTHRTPGELFVAGTNRWIGEVGLVVRGICPACSGTVDGSFHICSDHTTAPGEVCRNCGSQNKIRTHYVCSICKNAASFPAGAAVIDHPAVIAFRYEHGIELTYDLEDAEACSRLWDHLMEYRETLVSEDPLRIRISVPCEEATLHLTLDEELAVIDVTESRD